jgi:hypothetical protein
MSEQTVPFDWGSVDGRADDPETIAKAFQLLCNEQIVIRSVCASLGAAISGILGAIDEATGNANGEFSGPLRDVPRVQLAQIEQTVGHHPLVVEMQRVCGRPPLRAVD